jgi:hypothetical protein
MQEVCVDGVCEKKILEQLIDNTIKFLCRVLMLWLAVSMVQKLARSAASTYGSEGHYLTYHPFNPTNILFATKGGDCVIKIFDLAKACMASDAALCITLTAHTNYHSRVSRVFTL